MACSPVLLAWRFWPCHGQPDDAAKIHIYLSLYRIYILIESGLYSEIVFESCRIGTWRRTEYIALRFCDSRQCLSTSNTNPKF
jgi:hypothetical protein